jgi:hypothetical protein
MRHLLAQFVILVLFTASGALCAPMIKSSCDNGHGCCGEGKHQQQDPMRCCTLSSSSPKVTVAAHLPDFVAETGQINPESAVPMAEVAVMEPTALQRIEKRFLLLQTLRL